MALPSEGKGSIVLDESPLRYNNIEGLHRHGSRCCYQCYYQLVL